ncbi:hypothetical protein PPERSA_12578 [Pseudocohnilembus persalinus]|uniref:Peptidase S9 prolyl oligopeptidase catalytic domain-containing protein n=1 Tax=Pseudocohnilembus persalinus TaxID=266149 RepID=A0A0V0QCE5_PSEPJ|nr:hypothetical protein PPERSA_12578 [Pseudocohnilembus persalinus]|eukprot:KRW99902.1 hypothetical protein PPERSA_12578 [Pseudocohnilembus persalinus]
MEYSGYGIYKGNSSEQQIIDDALEIMKYLTININIDTQNIIIIGRSIGTGIATLLASQYEFMALFLISPFTSLRAVVKHIAGGIAQYFIKDRFKNIEYISKVQCPIYIVHGKQDKMIPYSHSLELKEQCPNAQKCKVDLPNNMTHVEIDFQRDLIQPFKSFLNQHSFLFKCRIEYSHQKSSGTNIEFPQEVYYNI